MKKYRVLILLLLLVSCKNRLSSLSGEDLRNKYNAPFILGQNFIGNTNTYYQSNEWLEKYFRKKWESIQITGYENGRFGVQKIWLQMKIVPNPRMSSEKISPITLTYELNTVGAPSLVRTFLMLYQEEFFEYNTNNNHLYTKAEQSVLDKAVFNLFKIPYPDFFLLPLFKDNIFKYKYKDPDQPSLPEMSVDLNLASIKLSYPSASVNPENCEGVKSGYNTEFMPTVGVFDRDPSVYYFYQTAEGLLPLSDVFNKGKQNSLELLDLIIPSTFEYGHIEQQAYVAQVNKLRGLDSPSSTPENLTQPVDPGAGLQRPAENDRNFSILPYDKIKEILSEDELLRLKNSITSNQKPSKNPTVSAKDLETIENIDYSNLKVNPLLFYFNLSNSLANYYCNFSSSKPPVLLAKSLNSNKDILRSSLFEHMLKQDLIIESMQVQVKGFIPLE